MSHCVHDQRHHILVVLIPQAKYGNGHGNTSPVHVVELRPQCRKIWVSDFPTIGILQYVNLCSSKTNHQQYVVCWNQYFR